MRNATTTKPREGFQDPGLAEVFNNDNKTTQVPMPTGNPRQGLPVLLLLGFFFYPYTPYCYVLPPQETTTYGNTTTTTWDV